MLRTQRRQRFYFGVSALSRAAASSANRRCWSLRALVK
jgi:hypothetical protein